MSTTNLSTLGQLALELAAGRTSARALVEDCLAQIAAPGGEGARAFLKVHDEQSRAAADFIDRLRAHGAAPGPYSGIPVSVKDLFDVAGDTTTAGSKILQGAPPARTDSIAVARLRMAGLIVIGRTNMTEFAYSGLGINPHHGTPLNPWRRAQARIPGGSSAGAAVSITDRMAFGALGTDTGGSCRIPAALCGVVGFKPTASRVPLTGCYPLSMTLDSIGPLANSVGCCAILDAILCGDDGGPDPSAPPPQKPIGALRLGVLGGYVLDDLAPEVAASLDRSYRAVTRGGAQLVDLVLPELAQLPELNRKGGFSAAEAYESHRERLSTHASEYDPRVAARILRGREQDAADYIALHRQRREFIARVSPRLGQFDAVLMPTTPIPAPPMAELASDQAYWRANMLMLRNPSIVNFLDGCAISVPCHEPGEAPVGLTIFGLRGSDSNLFAVAAAIESCLR